MKLRVLGTDWPLLPPIMTVQTKVFWNRDILKKSLTIVFFIKTTNPGSDRNLKLFRTDRSTVLGNGISMIFGLTERAIKPENERFQLRTIGTMKKICFGRLARREKGVLRAAHIPIPAIIRECPPPPPGQKPSPVRHATRLEHFTLCCVHPEGNSS